MQHDGLAQADFGARLGALIIDWGLSMLVAWALFGPGVIREHDWRLWMPTAVFFLEKSVMTAALGGSIGQLMLRLGVMRTDGRRIDALRSVLRALATCLVLPAIVSHEGRALHDTVLGTVVVSRR